MLPVSSLDLILPCLQPSLFLQKPQRPVKLQTQMRFPFPRTLEREKKTVFSFFFCSISIPVLLHMDPGLRGVPSWKRWTSKVSVLHSSIVKCPFDGNQGAQGWQILQKSEKLCWPSLLSFPLHLLFPLFSPLLHLLWLFDNAPPKNDRYSRVQLWEWLSVCEQVHVFCREFGVYVCVCVCAHKWTRQHVCVLWRYTGT